MQIESYSHEKNQEVMEVIMKLVEESKSGGRGDRGDRAGGDREPKVKVELGPPPEVGIIYRCVMAPLTAVLRDATEWSLNRMIALV